MTEVEWCLKQKRGIKIIEPNEDLARAYLLKAENSLKAAINLKDIFEWEISASYYAMYFSLYAILMRIGVKSEIHSCTIAFMKEYLSEYFSEDEIGLIKMAQKARIDLQYYSDRNVSKETYNKIKEKRSLFLVKCKKTLNELKEEEIFRIRKRLKDNMFFPFFGDQ